MDAKKTLEEMGEEGIARLIATKGGYFSWDALDERAALYGFNEKQAKEIGDELKRQGYLWQQLPDETWYGLRYCISEKGKELAKKYAGKFEFEKKFAGIMERERNGWR
ncbi:MAG: hypothetical protein AABX27_04970 [Nanoarchaeota archaeon]